MSQNYKNHTRLIPAWHYVTSLLTSALLGGAIVNFVNADHHMHYSAALILLISIIIIIFYWYIRAFALRAQDRAIRAEENFRHYLLTGKPLDHELRMSQVVALRFASDAEFPALAKKAITEKLSQKQIKQAIEQWKPDYYRV